MAGESDIKCWCAKNATEFVSWTEKNPGRRFVKCGRRVGKCGFWEWIDEPLPPRVRFVMDEKLRKANKKLRILQGLLVVLFLILMIVVSRGKREQCMVSCNCGHYELA